MNGATGITRKARTVVTRWNTVFQAFAAIAAVVHAPDLIFLVSGVRFQVSGLNPWYLVAGSWLPVQHSAKRMALKTSISKSHFIFLPYALCAMPYASGLLTADPPAAENLKSWLFTNPGLGSLRLPFRSCGHPTCRVLPVE